MLHHFPNKEATLIHVLGRSDEIDAPLVPDPGPSHRALIENIPWIVERDADTPGPVSLYVNLSAEATDPAHPAHEYFVQRSRVLRESPTTTFTALLGNRDTPTPKVAAQQFPALQDGLQAQWPLEPEVVNTRATVLSCLRELGIELPEEPILRHSETDLGAGHDLLIEASSRTIDPGSTDPDLDRTAPSHH